MALNYYGPLRLIRGLAPGMLERGDGHIINVSTWGVMSEASPMFGVYNASKARWGRSAGSWKPSGAARGCIDDAVLPVGGYSYDQTDEGV